MSSLSAAAEMDVVMSQDEVSTVSQEQQRVAPSAFPSTTRSTAQPPVIDPAAVESDTLGCGTKRGLCFSPSRDDSSQPAGGSAASPGRRKMSRVAVWAGTPWGSNRQAASSIHWSTPPPPPPPQAPTSPPPPQATLYHSSDAQTDANSFAVAHAARCADLLREFTDGRTAGTGLQVKWEAAAAAAAVRVGSAQGKGVGGAQNPADICAEEAMAPCWGTGGGGGSTGGFGGNSAPSRPAACTGNIVVGNGDEIAASTRRTDSNTLLLHALQTGEMLDVAMTDGDGDGSRGTTVGDGRLFGSGGRTVEAVRWASV